MWVRRHIPATLARIPSQKSMDVLVRALTGEQDGFLRFKLVSAIDRLRRRVPGTHLRPAAARSRSRSTKARATSNTCRCTTTCSRRRALPREGLLDEALEQKIARSRNRVFLLLGLLYPWRDIVAARWALEHGEGRSKASALGVPRQPARPVSIRRRLMPILDDIPLAERVRKGNVILRKTRERDVEETVLRLINDEDEVVSAAAIDFVGRNKLQGLVGDVEHVLAHRDVRDWHVFESASWALAGLRLAEDRRRSMWLEPLPAVEMADRLRKIPIFHDVTRRRAVPDGARGPASPVRAGSDHLSGRQRSERPLSAARRPRTGWPQMPGPSREVAPPAPLGVEEVLEGRWLSDTARTVDTSICLQLTLEEAKSMLADNTDHRAGAVPMGARPSGVPARSSRRAR